MPKYSYTPLTGKHLPSVCFQNLSFSTVLYLFLTGFLSTAAFFIGRKSTPSSSRVLQISNISYSDFDSSILLRFNAPAPLYYNRTFGSPPTLESDAAWASLFPHQGGFFRHPRLAPNRGALAVFHQLHCLDGLRQAIWLFHDQCGRQNHGDQDDEGGGVGKSLPKARKNSKKGAHDHSTHVTEMTDPAHLRHCVDLIRQTLMCRPDLTVETKNERLGGVTGFGSVHQCVRWGSLIDWVSEWEDWQPKE